MDLDVQKSALIQAILRIEDESLLTEIAALLTKENLLQEENAVYAIDDKERCKPMTVEEFQKRIKNSINDADNDRVISAKDLKEEIKKW